MFKVAFGALALCLFAGIALAQEMTPAIKADLAPTGKLRAGINHGNPLLAQRDAATGEVRGIAVDLSTELAKRLGVPVDLVLFDAAGKMADAVKAKGLDIAYLAIDPARAADISFTAPYLELEGTYLVPAGSPLKTIEDVDREGVRIAVTAKSAYDLFLSRSLKRAQLVRTSTTPASIDMFVAQKLDAVAAVRTALVAAAPRIPGSQVMPGRFMTIPQAAGVPKGREAGAGYVRQFIESMKASGFVAEALKRHGLQGEALVSPAAPPQ
jgi:polar amino acid transport system substrate-binding protein